MKKTIIFKSKGKNSSIIIANNYLNNYLTKLKKRNKKIYCVVDKKIKKYLNTFLKDKDIKFFFISGGESIKTIQSYKKIMDQLISSKIDRNSILIGIGGGTVGDISGFVASTLLRGIEFILIPTTLLSQVDSSVGGKNGINLKSGKNFVGTFYQPREVVIDTNFINNLPKREIKSGYAEIVKHALINDLKFFKWLEVNHKKIINLDLSILEKAIYKSIMIKLIYVKKDTKENLINNNSRAMLNFGHTIGHALETFYNYKKLNHGEAISIGMIIESKLSYKLGFLPNIELKRIINHFKKVGLKTSDNNIISDKIFNIMLKDKKNLDNNVNIVLLKNIGKSFFARNYKIDKIKKIIKNF